MWALAIIVVLASNRVLTCVIKASSKLGQIGSSPPTAAWKYIAKPVVLLREMKIMNVKKESFLNV